MGLVAIGNRLIFLSEKYPEIWFGHDVMRKLWTKIDNGELEGKRTRLGCILAKASTKEIEKIIFEIEEDKGEILKFFPHNPLDDIKEYVKELDEDKQYALVAAEV